MAAGTTGGALKENEMAENELPKVEETEDLDAIEVVAHSDAEEAEEDSAAADDVCVFNNRSSL
jgi:hypothetical protein